MCSRVLQVENVFYICGTPSTWYKSEFPWLWKVKRKNVVAWKYYLSFWEDRIHLSIMYLVTFCECDCSVEGLYIYFLWSLVYPCFIPFYRWGNRSSGKLRKRFSITRLLRRKCAGWHLFSTYCARCFPKYFICLPSQHVDEIVVIRMPISTWREWRWS